MRREEKRREEKRREEKRREEKRREEKRRDLSKIQSNNTSYIKNYNQCFNYFNWNIGFFILNNFGDN
ncbi:hypothetical protein [Brachyspira hyodysenteriae]|uniref:hypothetical protein n=1 Tax=Brachyspira hyodysenteriae TaxID=159 RepID=UPI0022CD4E00|nr:hypothetical protein [Brachyspira hyodysenteriae]MCZ9923060.1 hypothetical protein [Brachyspira hyodysenteriae]MCZ9941795.1 hypothetical protein [Brachyspira hyodysenteriae]MCZ9966206.1 hypothetical protein [Brachyspira hyodysenteriae]MDA0069249.1 hypothetical protein [Brachyspira hyodysenteriae]